MTFPRVSLNLTKSVDYGSRLNLDVLCSSIMTSLSNLFPLRYSSRRFHRIIWNSILIRSSLGAISRQLRPVHNDEMHDTYRSALTRLNPIHFAF
jgi:hypothetical protein